MSSCAEVEVESPFVLPRMKSKQMLPVELLIKCEAAGSIFRYRKLTFKGGALGASPLIDSCS